MVLVVFELVDPITYLDGSQEIPRERFVAVAKITHVVAFHAELFPAFQNLGTLCVFSCEAP
jgi:hypothetical protein